VASLRAVPVVRAVTVLREPKRHHQCIPLLPEPRSVVSGSLVECDVCRRRWVRDTDTGAYNVGAYWRRSWPDALLFGWLRRHLSHPTNPKENP